MSKLAFSLDKEKMVRLKKELIYLLIALVGAIVLFKLIFYNEILVNTIKLVASLFWLFVLPGHFIMLYWEKSLDFTERMIIGTALGVGLEGIFSYYLGILGINIRFLAVILPLVLILTGLYLFSNKSDSDK